MWLLLLWHSIQLQLRAAKVAAAVCRQLWPLKVNLCSAHINTNSMRERSRRKQFFFQTLLPLLSESISLQIIKNIYVHMLDALLVAVLLLKAISRTQMRHYKETDDMKCASELSKRNVVTCQVVTTRIFKLLILLSLVSRSPIDG